MEQSVFFRQFYTNETRPKNPREINEITQFSSHGLKQWMHSNTHREYGDFMFAEIFGHHSREKFQKLPEKKIMHVTNTLFTGLKDAVVFGHIPHELSKAVASFIKHSRTVTCTITGQYLHSEIAGGLERPCNIKFLASLVMINKLRTLLQVSQSLFFRYFFFSKRGRLSVLICKIRQWRISFSAE